MVNPEQALVLMLKGLRIFYLVIRVLYHQLKELQNLMTVSTNLENVNVDVLHQSGRLVFLHLIL